MGVRGHHLVHRRGALWSWAVCWLPKWVLLPKHSRLLQAYQSKGHAEDCMRAPTSRSSRPLGCEMYRNRRSLKCRDSAALAPCHGIAIQRLLRTPVALAAWMYWRPSASPGPQLQVRMGKKGYCSKITAVETISRVLKGVNVVGLRAEHDSSFSIANLFGTLI